LSEAAHCIKWISVLSGRRATIKAHPTTPHHPRPYKRVVLPKGRVRRFTVSGVSEKFESGWLTVTGVTGVSGVTLEFFKEVGEFLVWLVFC
jgi:hypothetical protein